MSAPIERPSGQQHSTVAVRGNCALALTQVAIVNYIISFSYPVKCILKLLIDIGPMKYRTFHFSTCPLVLFAGLSTCQYAWAFHSEAEEELLNMLPALQKEETTWPELRSMGVGWWLRSTNKLRRCIEKVRQLMALANYHYQYWSLCLKYKQWPSARFVNCIV